MIDNAIISFVCHNPSAFTKLQRMGVDESYFVDTARTVWVHLKKAKRDHDSIPSPDTLHTRFPDFELRNVRASEMNLLVAQLKQRRKYMRFIRALNDAAGNATDYEQVDDAIQALQAAVNDIAYTGNESHLRDLFSAEMSAKMVAEIQARRSGANTGIPTGLPRLDRTIGGLQKQKMVVLMARTGIGKTWMNLLFVAEAVASGRRVILYPLEMSLEETAFRLYTIFSSRLLGQDRVLKNYDITTGKVTKRKVLGLLNLLEDRFAGQLYVADVGNLSDRYTNERIEAEVEAHKPDLFWVDYLTLLKGPSNGRGDDKDWQAVAQLAEGVKNTAMRHKCVGGASAQVNRDAMKSKHFLPGPEHIAFGDGIAHPADIIIPINRKGDHLYYRVAKNRGGPEFGATKVKWFVNEGIMDEIGPDDGADSDGDIGQMP